MITTAAAAYSLGDREGLAVGIEAAYVLPSVLPVVTLAAVCWVILATNPSSSVTKVPSSNTLYMLWLCWLATYPCCPVVCNWTATSQRVYAPCTKSLRDLYVLLGVVSQSLNSLIGNIPDAINNWMVLVINCIGVYGLFAITCISWHCLMCQKRHSGALMA